jgi:hypothetical protein
VRTAVRRIGIGILVAAAPYMSAEAQVPPPVPPETLVVPIPLPPDSLRRDTIPTEIDPGSDTLRAPLARAEDPALADHRFIWDRDAIFASGALNLADLLERVPGATSYRSGWIASPSNVSYLGDLARVRVFLDGVLLPSLDPRNGELFDLTTVQLWPLEEVRIERGAGELRVHLRSWRVDRTIPSTRTDVTTGDERTNLFRAYFGRRYKRGEALQLGMQQYGTSARRLGGSADQLSMMARGGWAAGPWSTDAFFIRSRRTRELQERLDEGRPLPRLEGTRTDAYLRAGYGDPSAGGWIQVMAASLGWSETSPPLPGSGPPGDTTWRHLDTLRSETQYIASGGATLAGMRASATARLRVAQGEAVADQSVRLSHERELAGIALFAERIGGDSITNAEVSVDVSLPLSLGFTGAVGRRSPGGGSALSATTSARAEIFTLIRGLRVAGGALYRDGASLAAPVVYDTAFAPVVDDGARAGFVTLHGPIWRDIGIEAAAIRWENAGFYRPQYETRGTLYLNTSWLSRFPRGDFHIHAGVTHEYRTATPFPLSDGTVARADQSQIIGTLLEIRILRASLFWQFRNIRLDQYTVVPGFEMPRGINLYGVRWDWWN